VNFLQVHISPQKLENGEFDELLRFCRATGLRFALTIEAANWGPDGGRGRFDAAGGCHRWDLEPAALRKAAATGLFEGVVYDEGEHMQLSRNAYSRLSDKIHRKPYLVETTGMTLEQAYDAYLAAPRSVCEHNRTYGSVPPGHGRMLVESVFPALWHPLARANVALCPKLLKESIHPVVLGLALGAVKQYGGELWLTPDQWYRGRGFPGHTVADYAGAPVPGRRASGSGQAPRSPVGRQRRVDRRIGFPPRRPRRDDRPGSLAWHHDAFPLPRPGRVHRRPMNHVALASMSLHHYLQGSSQAARTSEVSQTSEVLIAGQ